MTFHALVLAAGQGSRMRSSLPKVLHPVLDRPMVIWALRAALDAGATAATVVVGHAREQVEGAVRGQLPDAPLSFAVQEEQRGTADAVIAAQEQWGAQPEPVAILYGDVPNLPPELLSRLVSEHKSNAALLSLVSARVDNPAGYGRIKRDADGAVTGIVESKDANDEELLIDEVNVGLYVIDPSFLAQSLPKLSPNNAQGELYLTDLVEMAAAEGRCHSLVADSSRELEGVNDRVQLSRAEALARAAIIEKWQREGVTVQDPSSARISADATLEQDSTLAAQVHILGNTHIGRGAYIDVGCVLRDTRVAADARLRPYTVATDSTIGERTGIGPFAHLRPDSHLGADVHIGNFVETKKTTMADGAKASHLSYLGDAEIGEGSNIGAGTITCNYDGVSKHRTEIGREVFVGSDTQLVAPVTIGDSAYIGAGSTITKDVPDGSLALSRVPQRTIDNWVALRMRKRDS